MADEQNNIQAEKQQNSKLFIIIVTISLLMSLVSLTLSVINSVNIHSLIQSNKPVVISKQYDKGRTLEKAKTQDKPIIVFFYTDWCGFCQKFAPTFDKVIKHKEVKKKFAIAFVNCENPENRDKIQEFQIEGFPTVYVIKNNGEKIKLENQKFYMHDSVNLIKDDLIKIITKTE